MIPFQQLMEAQPEWPRCRRLRAGGKGVNDSAIDGCVSSGTVPHTDVHPEVPSLRIPSMVIYQYFNVAALAGEYMEV